MTTVLDKGVELVVDGVVNTGKLVASGTNMAVDATIGTNQRIKEAREAHEIAIDETKDIKERCEASNKVQDAQRILGAAQRPIKEFEKPTISFSQKDRDGNTVSVKTDYWGDGWVPGTGFGFDIIPADSKYSSKIWVDVNYANLIEKVTVGDTGRQLNSECITIDNLKDLVKDYFKNSISGKYTIPAKYSENDKPIIVDGDEIYYEEITGGKKRKTKTKKNRKSKNRKSKNKRYSLKNFLTRK